MRGVLGDLCAWHGGRETHYFLRMPGRASLQTRQPNRHADIQTSQGRSVSMKSWGSWLQSSQTHLEYSTLAKTTKPPTGSHGNGDITLLCEPKKTFS